MTPSTSIFIRSYRKDFPWLNFCLKSIQKYCTGFDEIIVAIPECDRLNLTAETVIHVHDSQPGYMGQQVDKLNADQHTKSDYILYVDSDTVFTRPVTPNFFFRNGKPVWSITPWEALGEHGKKTWYHVMAKCLQEAPEHEFMRKGAILVPRTLLAGFREQIQAIHGCSMEKYVMNQPGHEFSEYNCLGFYLWWKHRERFHWHDTSREAATWPFRQFWSWGGITPEVRAALEQITGDATGTPNDITTVTNRRQISEWMNRSGLTGRGVVIGDAEGLADDLRAQWKGTLVHDGEDLDFVYLAASSLIEPWWNKLKIGGVLGVSESVEMARLDVTTKFVTEKGAILHETCDAGGWPSFWIRKT